MANSFKNRSVDASRFAMIPRPEVPRSAFRAQSAHKTTFDAGYLIPIYLDEVLPGDSHRLSMTAFARMATPIHPVMDNLHLDTFFFFVPNRLVWDNWQKFMGEQRHPGDSTDYLVPQVEAAPEFGDIYDYMGVPPNPGSIVHSFNALPFRAYNLIWNEWFRDQNMQDSLPINSGDGPDTPDYILVRRGKRHDYFTSALPWPQKGNGANLLLDGDAPVRGIGLRNNVIATVGNQTVWEGRNTSGAPDVVSYPLSRTVGGTAAVNNYLQIETDSGGVPLGIYADLSESVISTINELRTAFQVQKLLERDARGGTRYTEILRAHFGVTSPDARLQRPEYLGGGSVAVNVNPVAQTSESTANSAVGELGGVATATAHGHGFSQSFVEHGYIIGLAAVRADLTYQQGLHRMFSRRTKYDFYWPAFAHLGEQAILSKEIFLNSDPLLSPAERADANNAVFGYQARWEEYRYAPSRISGLFRSSNPLTLDSWHLAQEFEEAPVLDFNFIEDNPPMERVLAVGADAGGQQFLFDSFFDVKKVRPLPAYSVPGLMDHF